MNKQINGGQIIKGWVNERTKTKRMDDWKKNNQTNE